MPENPFNSEIAARQYALARPDYSSHATEILRRLLPPETHVAVAVDIGAGTGISSLALVPFAERVVAVEPSETMITYAACHNAIEYRQGSAENLPVDSDTCGLIAIGSALHWFDLPQFLDETYRVAEDGAWLIVLHHAFTATLTRNPGFHQWFINQYLEKYPSPPRDRSWRPPADLGDWRHFVIERFEQPVQFDPPGLADYLLTQSNLQVLIQAGDGSSEELRQWLIAETNEFFQEREETFLFSGFVAIHSR